MGRKREALPICLQFSLTSREIGNKKYPYKNSGHFSPNTKKMTVYLITYCSTDGRTDQNNKHFRFEDGEKQ